MSEYMEFIKAKHARADWYGIEVENGDIHPMLYDFQRHIVKWACSKGRAALFADCGLGKSFMQLEWLRLMLRNGGKGLIVAPLAVAQQTIGEAAKLGIEVVYSRDGKPGGAITICNYEMIHLFDAAEYTAVVLDESSILKSFMGKIKRQLLEMFADTPYRLACTATPAPNDYMELGNHADFLGIMPSNEMLMRWFINDTMAAGSYRLKKHAAKDFWRWVASWAVSIAKPSDMGYSDDGFILPPLNIIEHEVDSEMLDGSEKLFRDPSLNATGLHKELRQSAPLRAAKVAEIVAQSPSPWLIFSNANYEADEIDRRIEQSVDLRGSEAVESKVSKLQGFVNGDIEILSSKASMVGFGLNFQHCHNVIFTGLSYSYEQFYQAVRRCWRFGQKHPVNCHVVIGSAERALLASLRQKESQHEDMRREMIEAVQAEHLGKNKELALDYERDERSGRDWRLILGDSCQEIKGIEDNSVDLSIFSPPFANLYIYSDSACDMGNCSNEAEFFEHFKHLITDLYRITKPGRLACIHCKDLPRYKGRDGSAGLKDFPGEIVKAFEERGWTYHSRVTIWKDPVIEMQRTKNHGLLYKQLRADSCASRQGMADYVIVMRKWGNEEEWIPVTHTKDSFQLDRWQKWASPVWMDIDQMNVLNYHHARNVSDERHICPLQLDVIERCCILWSNPGDLVFSPFAGIGSEGYMALKTKRRFLGIELKRTYWEAASRHLNRAEREGIGLFDALEASDEDNPAAPTSQMYIMDKTVGEFVPEMEL